ncbi:hypothetical protein PM082_008226 [Marasmius tenuissimus]|nr:hypothetical protein PM082_008226 [Marasmius tenuissimus]
MSSSIHLSEHRQRSEDRYGIHIPHCSLRSSRKELMDTKSSSTYTDLHQIGACYRAGHILVKKDERGRWQMALAVPNRARPPVK